MTQRRACLGVLYALAFVGGFGCGDDQEQRDSATVPIVQNDAGAPDGASMLPSCVDGTPGCACADDSEPKTCYPPPIITKSGTNLCAQGTMYCRDGKWSTCESLVQYELNSTATDSNLSGSSRDSDLGAAQSALVTPPTTCSFCKPNCFTAVDRPVNNDFDGGTAPNVTYDPVQAGIRLTIKEDTAQRGPVAIPAVCGNGIVESVEQCDDGNKRTLDGCDANCLLENGFFCPLPGLVCLRSVCGNGFREGLEQCDDGNFLIGDGCTFLCTKEPKCTTGLACEPVCGDGKVFPGEACDDGNTVSGDGCSSSCGKEIGFVCADDTTTPPPYIDLPIVYRDFVGKDNALKPLGIVTNPYIHLDFENLNPGLTTNLVQLMWETDESKPTYKKPIATTPLNSNKAIQTPPGFNQWYTDDASVNKTFADTLRVTRDTTTGVYVFDSTAFFPLDAKPNTWVASGWEKASSAHNFSFTSEVRFWFIYTPPQKLDFRGDDDVWVFINGRRAVDIGGVHGPQPGSITLNSTNAATFGLVPGKLYEAAVFQAERHTTGSNYRLTLAGFVTGKTSCDSVCGDGIVTPDEFCDDGANNGIIGFCLPDCQGRSPVYFPTASYSRDYTAMGTCKIPPERPLWGALNWSAVATAGGTITFELRPSETAAGLATASPVSVTIPPYTASGSFDIRTALLTGGATLKDPPYLRVTAVLKSSLDMKQTPVLRSFDVTYNCVNIE